MILVKMGSRNIWRNKKRTILTVAAIAFAVMVLEFFFSIQVKSYGAAVDASVAVFHGHLQIQVEGYNDSPEIRSTIPNALELKAKLKEDLDIEEISTRSISFGLLASESRSYGAQVVGVEPDSEGDVSNIPGLIKEGKFVNSSDYLGAALGATLAKNLQVQVGDEVTLMSQGLDGSLVATILTVSGIFESGSTEVDRNIVEISLKDFDEQFEMYGGAHAIVVDTANVEDAEILSQKIKSKLTEYGLKKLVVLDWEELLPGLKQTINLDMSAGWLFYLSLILIVTFSILNTFLMSVLERTKEFGVLLSLGMKSVSISKLISYEAIILICLGVVLGNVFGALVVSYYHEYGFVAPGAEEIMKKWNLPNRIFPDITFQSFFYPSITVFLVSLLSIIYPAVKVLRLEPLKALQGEH